MLGCVLAVFGVLMVFQTLPASVGQPLMYGAQTATVVAACFAMLRRGRSSQGRLRQARLLVAAALMCGALGGVLAVLLPLLTGEPPPVPSVVDAVHFLFVPLVIAGLLSYPVLETESGSAARSLLDGLVAAAALWFTTYALLLGPARVGEGLPLLTGATVLAYPATDVFVLGLLVAVLARTQPQARRELLITGGGLALYLVADVAYSAVAARGAYRVDSWIGVVAEAGLLLLLLGTLSSEEQEAAPRSTAVRAGSRWIAVLPQVPVVVAIVVAAQITLTGGALSGGQLGVGVVLGAALVLRHTISGRDRTALDRRLQEREALFRSLVTAASDLITLHDGQGNLLYASPAVGRMLGRTPDSLLGSTMAAVVHPDDLPIIEAAWERARATPGQTSECVCRLKSVSGEWRWMQTLLLDRLDERGVGGVIVNSRDVHERHVLAEQLEHAAYHDALTGLGNLARVRALLATRYESVPPRPATLVLIDLDGFKAVNDTFGHARGDAVLLDVAGLLRACVRSDDEVARIGGDEFVLVLEGTDTGPAERVLRALRQPLAVAETSLPVGASVGIAMLADALSPDDLLRNADLAMYASKAAGRNRITHYQPLMHEAASQRMQLHRGLRRALDGDLLALHYQPIVDLPGGEVVGAEALLRWHDPDTGPIAPETFIPVAEESGIIADIDVWVLDRACRDIRAWLDAGLVVPRVSVNVSRRHMTLELPPLIEQTLRRHGLTGAHLCIEVTETAVVRDVDVACAALQQVRQLGVTIALDDFGSGQSSLSQLARLPVDTVKIDRSFTRTAVLDGGARRLLTSIVRVCQSLDLPVIAEGIETAELAVLLAEVGCDHGQGWHFGRAEPAVHLAGLLPARRLPASRTPEDAVRVRV